MRRLLLIVTGVLLVICLFGLSGCSSKCVKENEVFEDIKKSDTYCSTYDFAYDSMEIVKRMTDEEEKKDDVYVNFKCHNDDFEYMVECIAHYVLYNEGWIFENYEILNSDYAALTIPNETIVMEMFNLSKVAFDSTSYDENNPNMCCFLGYEKNEVSEYFSWNLEHVLKLEFTIDNGWTGDITDTFYTEDWNWQNIVGEWSLNVNNTNEGNAIRYLDITAINEQEIKFSHSEKWASENIPHWYNGVQKTPYENYKMNYVSGTGGYGVYYPDDFPIYEVQNSPFQLHITPYGIYRYIYEYNGEPNFMDKYTKES